MNNAPGAPGQATLRTLRTHWGRAISYVPARPAPLISSFHNVQAGPMTAVIVKTGQGRGSAAKQLAKPNHDVDSSGYEHEQPLRLICGFSPGFAGLVACLLPSFSAAALFSGDFDPRFAVLQCLLVLFLACHWLWVSLKQPKTQLVIFPDGRVLLSEDDGIFLQGTRSAESWQRGRMATVRVKFAWGTQNFVIFQKRQTQHEFRRLRVWLTHGRGLTRNLD